ncbi:MAG: 3-hydroxyacyl-CoA dehydrogenase family protein [Deltaproteobacteria bacterium]|nr:3-hydroxyacyl-CoA dehydrogenase family protein [Deltaproteobacteria bacterium]
MSNQKAPGKTVKTVGIVGSGTMGRRIAFSCILSGKETRLYGRSPEKVQTAKDAVRALIEERTHDGGLSVEALEPATKLLTGVTSLDACISGADMVIESVSENIQLKREIFSAIDPLVGPETLLCSGTSSIPGSQLADTVNHPENFLNLNFGGPDNLKVEIMSQPLTAQKAMDTATAFVRGIGLVPILVKKEIMGYAHNRLWRAMKKEVLFLINEGHIDAHDMDRAFMLEWNVPIGPCGLMDEIGLDVVRDIEMNCYKATGDPSDHPPQVLTDLVDQGKLGIKSGEGFYVYPNPAYEQPGFLKGE